MIDACDTGCSRPNADVSPGSDGPSLTMSTDVMTVPLSELSDERDSTTAQSADADAGSGNRHVLNAEHARSRTTRRSVSAVGAAGGDESALGRGWASSGAAVTLEIPDQLTRGSFRIPLRLLDGRHTLTPSADPLRWSTGISSRFSPRPSHVAAMSIPSALVPGLQRLRPLAPHDRTPSSPTVHSAPPSEGDWRFSSTRRTRSRDTRAAISAARAATSIADCAPTPRRSPVSTRDFPGTWTAPRPWFRSRTA